MRTIIDDLRHRILLSDGATGTELYRRGLPQGTCIEEWNLSHPDAVRSVSIDYLAAGSDIVETNTLGASRLMLARHGLAEQAAEINRRSARLAREAAGEDRIVFGSVGPTGDLLKPFGTRTETEMVAAFAEQMIALAEGGVDAICIETQISLDEALAALKAARENTELPVAVTMTFKKTPKGEFRTVMGDSPERMAERLGEAGASIIGSNCGQGPVEMLELCRALRPLTSLPLMIQSNAGLPTMQDGETVFKATAQEMAEVCIELARAGASIIGGCCGTAPPHIRAMREALDRLPPCKQES